MDPSHDRPWHRLHFPTWAVLAALAALLVLLNIRAEFRRLPGSESISVGWPATFVEPVSIYDNESGGWRIFEGFRSERLALDMGVAMMLLGACAWASERTCRRLSILPRFCQQTSLSSLPFRRLLNLICIFAEVGAGIGALGMIARETIRMSDESWIFRPENWFRITNEATRAGITGLLLGAAVGGTLAMAWRFTGLILKRAVAAHRRPSTQ